MRHLRILTGVLGLTVVLALAGCGQSDAPQASLEVLSVPAAEIYVDGVSHGMSPAAISLGAGDHEVVLRHDKFESFETHVTLAATETQAIDAVLRALDPSDPVVIAKLAEAEGLDVAPFVAPELTRGSAQKSAAAVLLWPGKDVRRDGLVNYAIEADESYAGDATLEFRHGRKVLYREPFTPETVTTVRTIPAAVREHARVGTKIRWGLYFEDRRRPITSEFRIVNRPKAERQLGKLSRSRHMARQPEITQQIMQATVLENNRLYTEALIRNLDIATAHPGSTQPYRGIVTTLRRLDAENSELFALVSRNVGGKGGHSGVSRPGIAGRTAADSLGIDAWSPRQATEVPTPTVPQTATESGPTVAPEAQPATPDTSDVPTERVDPFSEQLEAESAALGELEQRIEASEQAAQEARSQATELEQAAIAAQEAADAARAALESAADPTPEQAQAMRETAEAAANARDAAEVAGAAAAAEQSNLRTLREELAERNARIEALRGGVDGAENVDPEPTPPTAVPEADIEELRGNVEAASSLAEQARTEWEQATTAVDQAQSAFDADPTPENAAKLRDAQTTMEGASRQAHEAQQQLEAAQSALEQIGNQVRESNDK